MGYKIEYPHKHKPEQENSPPGLRFRALTAAFALVSCIAVRLLCPEGEQLLGRVLLPGERTPTEQAFAQMLEELRDGAPFEDSVTVFCKQILDNGEKLDPQN